MIIILIFSKESLSHGKVKIKGILAREAGHSDADHAFSASV
jgi:hypothetical protein